MKHFATIYKKATGEIVQCSSFVVPEENDGIIQQFEARVLAFGAEDHAYLDIETSPASDYIGWLNTDPKPLPRPQLMVEIQEGRTTLQAGGDDVLTFTEMPDPCEIIVDAHDPDVETHTHTVTGGGFIFEAENPGVYTVEVRRFPFLPWRCDITAT